ncbi:hypothetical protein A8990_11876 [Paenibacillus taihuensis]|uniref:YtkA-like protein n=1 Tax=Paenibacillus taihuensis TaxID=1156355 RepID=A0A3D9RUY6_9BACL|nr:hypothetical protein [Paenibacillus taihuensis]REE81551.1 hypothetical protein A8990_11876 [Paenibacillus taihuensis]
MKNKVGMLLASCLLIVLLITSCSSAKEVQEPDPASIKVALSTNPSPATVGKKIQLSATIIGLLDTDGAEVQFDIREPDNSGMPALVNATLNKDGTFKANHVFEKAQTYKVYIHLYQNELHISKKSELVVQQ